MKQRRVVSNLLAVFAYVGACACTAAGAAAAPAADRGGAPDATGGSLRVMSFNIRYGTANDGENRWEARRELLLRTIESFDPDLLGVQEALASQCDELRERLAGHGFVGVGRDDGGRRGEFSAILFRSARFEKLGEGHFWLSPTPDVPGSKGWDAAITRIATWVKLRDKGRAGAAPLLLVNTHWDHRGRAARLESAKLIRRKLRALHPGGPVVLIGDMNTTEDDPPYAELTRPAAADAADPPDGPRLTDSYRTVHPRREADEATYHGFTGDRRGSRIDFVFHSAHLEAAEASIVRDGDGKGRYPSDHFAVTAVLRPTANPRE